MRKIAIWIAALFLGIVVTDIPGALISTAFIGDSDGIGAAYAEDVVLKTQHNS